MTADRRDFNYQINGLRGICILLVFLFHVYNSGFVPVDHLGLAGYFISTFKYGVEIFFMISGYVILNSIRRKPNLRAFFIERALRIYPTWLPIHFITFIVAPLVGKVIIAPETGWSAWIGYFFSALLLATPVVPTPLFHPAAWSLSYEWCFYLVTGGAFFLIHRRAPAAAVAGLVAVVAASFINFFPRALFFIPGILAAVYEPWIKAHKKFFLAPGLVTIAFLMTWGMTGAGPAERSVLMTDWMSSNKILFAALSLVLGCYMFASVVAGSGVYSRILLNKVMQFFGKVSYAFYLWSPLVFFPAKALCKSLIPHLGLYSSFLLFAVLSMALSILVSWTNWFVIERKLTLWLKEKVRRFEE